MEHRDAQRMTDPMTIEAAGIEEPPGVSGRDDQAE